MYPMIYPDQRPITVQAKHSPLVTERWALERVNVAGKNDLAHHQRVGVMRIEEISS